MDNSRELAGFYARRRIYNEDTATAVAQLACLKARKRYRHLHGVQRGRARIDIRTEGKRPNDDTGKPEGKLAPLLKLSKKRTASMKLLQIPKPRY